VRAPNEAAARNTGQTGDIADLLEHLVVHIADHAFARILCAAVTAPLHRSLVHASTMRWATQAPSSCLSTLRAVRVAPNRLDRRHMAHAIDGLAPGPLLQLAALDRDGDAA
jgi:hypothetical protein